MNFRILSLFNYFGLFFHNMSKENPKDALGDEELEDYEPKAPGDIEDEWG